MKNILSALTLLLIGIRGFALDGAWRGELTVNASKLPLVFNFATAADGSTLSCTLDSPLQGVKGMPANVAFYSADSVCVKIARIGAQFAGRITASEIKGTFMQSGFSFPLVLTPERSIYERRPQTPREPFPYSTLDTVFASADGTLLAATIAFPVGGAAAAPAVVLVTGSGPQNRDEEMFDHRPFAVIADFLARQGIASLRYDDRGVQESGGKFATADLTTFKADAEAAVKFLRGVAGMGKVGVLGHSEGGTIASQLASEGCVDFAVSLAGAFVDGKDLIMAQNLRSLNQMPMAQQQKDDAIKLISTIFDKVIAGTPYADINVDQCMAAARLQVPPMVVESLRRNLAASKGSYFRDLLSLKPSQWLGGIAVPFLALNGSADTQVISADNLAAISQADASAIVKEYPGLNHLFQHATTGEVAEYEQISETISPEVLADIAAFIHQCKGGF